MPLAERVHLHNPRHPRELLTPINSLGYHGMHIAKAEFAADYMMELDGTIRERKYSAFVQLFLKRGNKIAAVSFPLPLGVSADMAEEMLQRTLSPEEPNGSTVKTFGEKRELRTLEKEGIEEGILSRFAQSAKDVIDEKHPSKKHKTVNKFYKDSTIRMHYLSEVAQEVEEILSDQQFLKISAWRAGNKGRRIFTLEYFFDERKGKVLGIGPAPEYRVFDVATLASDSEHGEWLADLVAWAKSTKDGIKVHLDAGKTVDGCAGSKRCSVFFDEMELDSLEGIFDLATGEAGDQIIDPLLWQKKKESESCDICQKKRKVCRGHSAPKEAAVANA